MRAASLISLSLITGGLLALFALQSPGPWNPFFAPYPNGRIEKIAQRSYRFRINRKKQVVSATKPLSLEFAVPEKLALSDSLFLAVTAEVKSKTDQEAAFSLSDGTHIAYAAPLPPSDGWQTITTVFPHAIEKRNFKVSFKGKNKFYIKSVDVNIRRDERYSRRNCSKTEVMLNGDIGTGFDVNEHLNYPKNDTTRIVFVGNSTVQGCGAPNGATLSYILQHKLDRIAPKKFQVMNFGIPGASFLGHIVSITNFYPVRQEHLPSVEDALYYLHRHPSLKDLQPDYVVLSVHWNDLENYLGYMSRKYQSHEDGAILADTLLLDETLESFLKFIDSPTTGNRQQYEAVKETINAAAPASDFDKGKLFEKHLTFLLERYLSRLQLHLTNTKVIMMTLPDLHKEKSPVKTESLVQRASYAKVAKKFGIPLIDLSTPGEEIFKSNRRAMRFARAFIFSGKIHFKYRGNQWLIDRAFPDIKKVLKKGELL